MNRNLRNKRGGPSSFVLIVITILIILISGAAIGSFSASASSIIPGKVSVQKCRWTLDIKHKWDNMVDGGAKDIADIGRDVDSHTWLPGENVQRVGNTFSGNGWNSNLELGANDMEEGGLDSLKLSVDMCVANTKVSCIGPADYVADCLYSLSTDTYYGLGGGKEEAKTKNYIDDTTWENFVLFNISVNITRPGNIKLYGGCDNYTTQSDVTTSTFTFQQMTDGNCNVTIRNLDEALITLVMISKCQDYGPGDTENCKCFPWAHIGNQLGNGLHNNNVSDDASWSPNSGTYLREDVFTSAPYPSDFSNWTSAPHPDYAGCGGKFPGDDDIQNYISDPRDGLSVGVDHDPILITSEFRIGEQENAFTRLELTRDRVYMYG
ncbi:MAG: hypothetical protein ABIG20_02100 [archaeon]